MTSLRSLTRRVINGLARRILRRAADSPAPAPPVATPPPDQEPESIEIDGAQLAAWLKQGTVRALDVREPNELYAGHADGAWLIPMNQIPARLAELPRDRHLVVYCAAGARSHGVADHLRKNGFPDAWSLAGGFGAWVAAGGPHVRPPSNAKFPIASRVNLDGEPASVQHIEESPAGMRYTVRRAADGSAAADVSEDRLSRR